MKTAKKGKDKAKEALKPVDDRKVGKKKPRRPPSAYRIFQVGFREDFWITNPNVKPFPAVFYAAAEKWRSMSQAEKAPYEEKSANWDDILQHEKRVDAYNKNMKKGSDEPEKSRSDVNDEDEEATHEHLEKGNTQDEKGVVHGLKI